MDIFLKMKHWHLFVLNFVIPVLVYLFMIISLDFYQNNPLSLVSMIFKSFTLLITFTFAGYLCWIWAVGINLRERIPDNIKIKPGKFKFFFMIFTLCVLLYIIFIGVLPVRFLSGEIGKIESFFTWLLFFSALIVPLAIFAIASGLYCIYFTAKVLKTIELQREVLFSDFAGEAFLFWLFPAGVWVLQPRINKIIQSKLTNGN